MRATRYKEHFLFASVGIATIPERKSDIINFCKREVRENMCIIIFRPFKSVRYCYMFSCKTVVTRIVAFYDYVHLQ